MWRYLPLAFLASSMASFVVFRTFSRIPAPVSSLKEGSIESGIVSIRNKATNGGHMSSGGFRNDS